MTIKNDITQALRAWVIAATGYDNEHVIPGDDADPERPSFPYIVVDILTLNIREGSDQIIQTYNAVDDQLEEKVLGRRRGTISLRGFGVGSGDAIMIAELKLESTAIAQLNCDNKISIEPFESGMPDATNFRETSQEQQWTRDFEIRYAIVQSDGNEDIVGYMEEFKFEGDYESQVTTTLNSTITVT